MGTTPVSTLTNAADSYPVYAETASFTFSGEAAGEIIQCVNVKKGYEIVEVILESDDLGSAVTLSVGDGNSTTRFITATDTDSGAFVRMNNGAGVGYTYTADDTIDVVTGVEAATGTFTLTVFYKKTYN